MSCFTANADREPPRLQVVTALVAQFKRRPHRYCAAWEVVRDLPPDKAPGGVRLSEQVALSNVMEPLYSTFHDEGRPNTPDRFKSL